MLVLAGVFKCLRACFSVLFTLVLSGMVFAWLGLEGGVPKPLWEGCGFDDERRIIAVRVGLPRVGAVAVTTGKGRGEKLMSLGLGRVVGRPGWRPWRWGMAVF